MLVSKIGNLSFKETSNSLQAKPTQNATDSSQNEENLFSTKNLLIAGAALAAIAFAGIAIYRSRKSNAIQSKSEQNLSLADQIIVTGKDRVRELVSKFTHDDFDSSKIFKVNMHIHSNKSDGKLTPLQVLQQAKMFADKLPKGEKFTFSLTDHDTIAGVQEIVKEIRRNPKEYANVRFIPGIEMSTTYSNPQIMRVGADLDFLIYGFNPDDPKLLQEISRRRNILSSSLNQLIEDVNSRIGEKYLTLKQLQNPELGHHLHYIGSNGYIHDLSKLLTAILPKKNIPEDEVLAIITKYFGHNKLHLKANISTLDAVKLANEINAFSSIAHPGKISFSNSELLVPGTDATNNLISSVINAGGDAIECHYMGYSKPNYKNWWEQIRAAFKTLNLTYYRTGGYDTHGRTITLKNKTRYE